MRSLTLGLAASLLAGTTAFAASSSMSNDAMSGATTSGKAMSGKSMSGDTMSPGATSKHMASTQTSTHVTTGKIRSIDTAANTLTLSSGKKFLLPANFSATSVKAGERVKVSYQMAGKQMSATSVRAAK